MYTVATKFTPTEGVLLDITNFQYVCNFRSSNSVGILTDLFCLHQVKNTTHY